LTEAAGVSLQEIALMTIGSLGVPVYTEAIPELSREIQPLRLAAGHFDPELHDFTDLDHQPDN